MQKHNLLKGFAALGVAMLVANVASAESIDITTAGENSTQYTLEATTAQGLTITPKFRMDQHKDDGTVYPNLWLNVTGVTEANEGTAKYTLTVTKGNEVVTTKEASWGEFTEDREAASYQALGALEGKGAKYVMKVDWTYTLTSDAEGATPITGTYTVNYTNDYDAATMEGVNFVYTQEPIPGGCKFNWDFQVQNIEVEAQEGDGYFFYLEKIGGKVLDKEAGAAKQGTENIMLDETTTVWIHAWAIIGGKRYDVLNNNAAFALVPGEVVDPTKKTVTITFGEPVATPEGASVDYTITIKQGEEEYTGEVSEVYVGAYLPGDQLVASDTKLAGKLVYEWTAAKDATVDVWVKAYVEIDGVGYGWKQGVNDLKTLAGNDTHIELTHGDPDSVGIESIISNENAPAVYYNLNGTRVANPTKGIYLRSNGSKVEKVVVK